MGKKQCCIIKNRWKWPKMAFGTANCHKKNSVLYQNDTNCHQKTVFYIVKSKIATDCH
jgi:hypothetical protein